MRDIRISVATITLFLIFLGIIMIYSSSGIYAMQVLGDQLFFLKRHVFFVCVGLLASLGCMALDYRDLRKVAKPLLLFSVFLLVMVLIPGIGKSSYGAQRWFKLGPIYFQPSELTKICVLVYIADFLARKQQEVKRFGKGFLPALLVLGAVSLLILKQPDLGSMLLIFSVALIMLFVAGTKLKYLWALVLAGLPGFYFMVVKVPYRWRRIVAFLDPWEDVHGAGFQLIQSQVAFGNGGFWGVGLGKSVQKLFYLPAAHTDFILSIIGEELGFLGAFLVIALFVCFIWQGSRIAKRTQDLFGYYLSVGIVALIGLQAVINVGVSIGALPTKGLPLPFISYGGSSLVFNMISVALLLNVSRVEDL
jgi:cell division protein FtsW